MNPVCSVERSNRWPGMARFQHPAAASARTSHCYVQRWRTWWHTGINPPFSSFFLGGLLLAGIHLLHCSTDWIPILCEHWSFDCIPLWSSHLIQVCPYLCFHNHSSALSWYSTSISAGTSINFYGQQLPIFRVVSWRITEEANCRSGGEGCWRSSTWYRSWDREPNILSVIMVNSQVELLISSSLWSQRKTIRL